jgi:hypothetical protein
MEPIGYQDGIVAEYNALRDLYPSKTLLVKDPKGGWPSLDTLADVPLEQWKAWDKAQRRAQMLKDDHDARAGEPIPPEPEPEPLPPEPELPQVAPMAYMVGTNNADPRYCCFEPDGSLRPGLSWVDQSAGVLTDTSGALYNRDGLCTGGNWRNRNVRPPGLLPANSMDDRSVCDSYTGTNGVPIGGAAGYPKESYQ